MDRPAITGDQREMAVELLANALRKDVHLRNRDQQSIEEPDPLRAAMSRRRSEPSRRYIDGMLDLLKVLFPNGHAVAAECLDEAYARAMGMPARGAKRDPDMPYH
jgi:hypothetical protein